MNSIRFQPRGCFMVTGTEPALFLVATKSRGSLRCAVCGRFMSGRGMHLVVCWFTGEEWLDGALSRVNPAREQPWCLDCAHTGWRLVETDYPDPDATASGWQYLGIPVTTTRLQPRADGRGLAHRWRGRATHHDTQCHSGRVRGYRRTTHP